MRIYKSVVKNIDYIKNINHNSSDIVSRIITNNNRKIEFGINFEDEDECFIPLILFASSIV